METDLLAELIDNNQFERVQYEIMAGSVPSDRFYCQIVDNWTRRCLNGIDDFMGYYIIFQLIMSNDSLKPTDEFKELFIEIKEMFEIVSGKHGKDILNTYFCKLIK